MTLVRVAALLAVMTLLGACAHHHGPMPCGCLPPPAEEPAKG